MVKSARVIPSVVADRRPEAELVELARAGDRWAQQALFGRHVRPVIRRAQRLIGDPEEAADLAQDALTTAFAKLDRLKDPDAFGAWLMQIAVRRCHDALRKRRLLKTLGLYHTEDSRLATLVAEGASPEIKAELALLDRTISRLSPALRIAWILRFVEGEQLQDIAKTTGCSLATVKRRLKQADAQIRARVRLDRQEEK